MNTATAYATYMSRPSVEILRALRINLHPSNVALSPYITSSLVGSIMKSLYIPDGFRM